MATSATTIIPDNTYINFTKPDGSVIRVQLSSGANFSSQLHGLFFQYYGRYGTADELQSYYNQIDGVPLNTNTSGTPTASWSQATNTEQTNPTQLSTPTYQYRSGITAVPMIIVRYNVNGKYAYTAIPEYGGIPNGATQVSYDQMVNEVNSGLGNADINGIRTQLESPSKYVLDNGTFRQVRSTDTDPNYQAPTYTGQTAGYTQGGVLLYKLSDGSVTATPPNGETKQTPLTQEQMQQMTPEQLTGGVVTSGSNTPTGATPTPTTVAPTVTSSGTGTNSAPAGTGSQTASQVDSLYQKYFGRPATTQEQTFWQTQPSSALENQLLTDYKQATGLTSYDGSPIKPNTAGTVNQIASGQTSVNAGQAGSTSSTTGTTTATGGYVYGGDTLNKVASKEAVNALYTAYFGRDATQAELDNWANGSTTVKQMEDYLISERAKYGYTAPVKNINEIQSWNLPSEILNSPEYQALSADQKAIIGSQWKLMQASTTEERTRYEAAMQEAIKQVDPYSKVMLQFALNSIPDEFRITKLSAEDKLKSLQEAMQELENTKTDLTLEQQQEMGAIKRQYENDITNLQDQMAESGLTYSSKRSDLEKFIAEQNQDLIMSKNRSYASQMRQLDTSALQNQRTQELTKQATEAQLKALAMGAEQQVGTTNWEELQKKYGLTGLSGTSYTSVGDQTGTNFAGTLEEQRKQMILNLANTIKQFENPSSMTTLLGS